MEKTPKPESKPKLWAWGLLVTALAALVLVASFLAIWKHFLHFGFQRRRHHESHGSGSGNYGDALSVAVQFFDVQKCKRIDDLCRKSGVASVERS